MAGLAEFPIALWLEREGYLPKQPKSKQPDEGILPSERMTEITYREQHQAKHGTPEIEIMTNAIRQSPPHPRKQGSGFSDMDQHRQH